MDKLLLCPFCAGAAFITKGVRGSNCIVYVRCGLCEATGEKFGSKFENEAKEQAINAWNNRKVGV